MARSALAAFLAAAALPGVAVAQKAANVDAQKQPFCRGYDFAPDHSGQTILTSIGSGRSQADLFFLYRADPVKARFPGARDPFLQVSPGDDAITPSIGIWYRFTLSQAGQPDSDVLPVAMQVTSGDFLDAPQGDRSLYKLRLEYGGRKLPFYTSPSMFASFNNMSGVVASVATPPQQANVTLAQAELNQLVSGLDGSARTIVIERAGTDIAYLPIANRPVAAERDKMFAWIRSTLPLLKNGNCPAS